LLASQASIRLAVILAGSYSSPAFAALALVSFPLPRLLFHLLFVFRLLRRRGGFLVRGTPKRKFHRVSLPVRSCDSPAE
jgi:hypothetical protein